MAGGGGAARLLGRARAGAGAAGGVVVRGLLGRGAAAGAAGPGPGAGAGSGAGAGAGPSVRVEPGSPLEATARALAADLPHLFDDVGIDRGMYSEEVQFEDPITRYSSLDGYLFNIQMLRRLFSPTFTLRSVRQTGDWELTTRWTMGMTFALLPWRPPLVFTGTSVMGVDPDNGKFLSHVDTWDSIEDQKYLSVEGLQDLLRQLQPSLTPDLETPGYEVLSRRKDYEVRRYEEYAVAETPVRSSAGAAAGEGFNELAGYIFGGNAEGESMPMTTPVISWPAGARPRTRGAGGPEAEGEAGMQFVVRGGDKPRPTSGSGVRLGNEAGGLVAALRFPGLPSDAEVLSAERRLRAALDRDGLGGSNVAPGWRLARYNEPYVPAPLRRNEVLVDLVEFSFPK